MSAVLSQPSKRWDLSIEMLKAIAAILVMNSHMDAMYGEYSWMATGGAIGDALFFFCSGYTLFLSNREENFFNWYKRRIQRIFPAVFICTLLVATYEIKQQLPAITMYFRTSWFIYCILIYYILLYPIKRYANKNIGLLLATVAGISLLYYFTIGVEPASLGNIYGATFFKWVFFFFFMLFGAVCGKWRMNILSSVTIDESCKVAIRKNPNTLIVLIGLLGSLVVFYGVYIYTKQNPQYEAYQLFSLIPLVGVCWFLWRFACSEFSVKLMHSKYLGVVVRFVGGLCLEILLCQNRVFTTELNRIFPVNILIIMVGVILLAYVVRIFSRIFLQTFQKEKYDWRAIIEPF